MFSHTARILQRPPPALNAELLLALLNLRSTGSSRRVTIVQ